MQQWIILSWKMPMRKICITCTFIFLPLKNTLWTFSPALYVISDQSRTCFKENRRFPGPTQGPQSEEADTLNSSFFPWDPLNIILTEILRTWLQTFVAIASNQDALKLNDTFRDICGSPGDSKDSNQARRQDVAHPTSRTTESLKGRPTEIYCTEDVPIKEWWTFFFSLSTAGCCLYSGI